MNGVDLADQGRAECPTKRRTCLTWRPCFSFLFDTSLCNMAKLYEAHGHYNRRHKKGLNNTFRRLLASKLMAKAAARTYVRSPGIRPGCRTVLSNVVANSSQIEGSGAVPRTEISDTQHHGELVKGGKQDTCKACQASRRYASSKPRVVLGEIPNEFRSTKPRAPRTSYQCSQCFIALCNMDLCWNDHLAAYLENTS
jgi:hypothetical protein